MSDNKPMKIVVRQMFAHPQFGGSQTRQWMFNLSEIQEAVNQFNECLEDSYNSRTIEFVIVPEML